jgi:hypothetical protein
MEVWKGKDRVFVCRDTANSRFRQADPMLQACDASDEDSRECLEQLRRQVPVYSLNSGIVVALNGSEGWMFPIIVRKRWINNNGMSMSYILICFLCVPFPNVSELQAAGTDSKFYFGFCVLRSACR